MNTIFKRFAFLTLMAVTVAFTMFPVTPCMEEKAQENPSHELLLFQALRTGEFIKEVGRISDLSIHILKDIAALSLLSQPIDEWSVVHEKWPSIMKKHKVEIFQLVICQVYEVDPETCERFLKGKLIYKPNENNDIGRIELRISDLANPLEGTFDLSQCGDAGQHLSISTGYRKGEKTENEDKVEICFAPRFLIKKELNTTAKHFQTIFPNWGKSVEVGIFWSWGNWDDLGSYDYLITQNMDNLSQNNLYEKWSARAGGWSRRGVCDRVAYVRLHPQIIWAKNFMLFLNSSNGGI